MLLPSDRRIMEGYGCRVCSTYQTTETGRIGFQCERCEGFHLNVDLCAVRVIDEEGEPAGPGELGDLVVSNLHNRATVLLNYRVGDMGRMSTEPCACGRSLPLLSELQGHYTGFLYSPNGQRISALPLHLQCAHLLEQGARFQIVQPALDRVVWRMMVAPDCDRESLSRGLIQESGVYLGPRTQVSVEFVDSIETTGAGKLQDVVQMVQLD
jgi:phenylacetate-CoA ligase